MLGTLPVLLLVALVSVPLRETEWASAFVPGVWAITGIVVGVRVVLVPQLRWRQWRYEVRASEIDLRRGAFTVRRTLVPMSRVQHVDTRRTVLSQFFGLAAVVFHTAAGANEIPALTETEAAAIRDRIAELAAMSDDPV
jgi:membrane protein YdbS with pleckstrin-like domain